MFEYETYSNSMCGNDHEFNVNKNLKAKQIVDELNKVGKIVLDLIREQMQLSTYNIVNILAK